ncbi:hypothetical protein VP01_1363g1, partial [Puccinia sorghi]
MEVDAVQTLSRSLLDSSRNLCRSRNLCFRCLKPIVPGSHVGSLNCPNAPVTMDQRKAFIDRFRTPRPAQVSMVSSALSPDSLPSAPTSAPSLLAFQSPSFTEEDRPLLADVHGDFDEQYDDYDAADCATVSSQGGTPEGREV